MGTRMPVDIAVCLTGNKQYIYLILSIMLQKGSLLVRFALFSYHRL